MLPNILRTVVFYLGSTITPLQTLERIQHAPPQILSTNPGNGSSQGSKPNFPTELNDTLIPDILDMYNDSTQNIVSSHSTNYQVVDTHLSFAITKRDTSIESKSSGGNPVPSLPNMSCELVTYHRPLTKQQMKDLGIWNKLSSSKRAWYRIQFYFFVNYIDYEWVVEVCDEPTLQPSPPSPSPPPYSPESQPPLQSAPLTATPPSETPPTIAEPPTNGENGPPGDSSGEMGTDHGGAEGTGSGASGNLPAPPAEAPPEGDIIELQPYPQPPITEEPHIPPPAYSTPPGEAIELPPYPQPPTPEELVPPITNPTDVTFPGDEIELQPYPSPDEVSPDTPNEPPDPPPMDATPPEEGIELQPYPPANGESPATPQDPPSPPLIDLTPNPPPETGTDSPPERLPPIGEDPPQEDGIAMDPIQKAGPYPPPAAPPTPPPPEPPLVPDTPKPPCPECGPPTFENYTPEPPIPEAPKPVEPSPPLGEGAPPIELPRIGGDVDKGPQYDVPLQPVEPKPPTPPIYPEPDQPGLDSPPGGGPGDIEMVQFDAEEVRELIERYKHSCVTGPLDIERCSSMLDPTALGIDPSQSVTDSAQKVLDKIAKEGTLKNGNAEALMVAGLVPSQAAIRAAAENGVEPSAEVFAQGTIAGLASLPLEVRSASPDLDKLARSASSPAVMEAAGVPAASIITAACEASAGVLVGGLAVGGVAGAAVGLAGVSPEVIAAAGVIPGIAAVALPVGGALVTAAGTLTPLGVNQLVQTSMITSQTVGMIGRKAITLTPAGTYTIAKGIVKGLKPLVAVSGAFFAGALAGGGALCGLFAWVVTPSRKSKMNEKQDVNVTTVTSPPRTVISTKVITSQGKTKSPKTITVVTGISSKVKTKSPKSTTMVSSLVSQPNTKGTSQKTPSQKTTTSKEISPETTDRSMPIYYEIRTSFVTETKTEHVTSVIYIPAFETSKPSSIAKNETWQSNNSTMVIQETPALATTKPALTATKVLVDVITPTATKVLVDEILPTSTATKLLVHEITPIWTATKVLVDEIISTPTTLKTLVSTKITSAENAHKTLVDEIIPATNTSLLGIIFPPPWINSTLLASIPRENTSKAIGQSESNPPALLPPWTNDTSQCTNHILPGMNFTLPGTNYTLKWNNYTLICINRTLPENNTTYTVYTDAVKPTGAPSSEPDVN